jgi:hypothetical protein
MTDIKLTTMLQITANRSWVHWPPLAGAGLSHSGIRDPTVPPPLKIAGINPTHLLILICSKEAL